VIHVFGLEFDEEDNGDVRFQISFLGKKLKAFTSSIFRRPFWVQVEHFKWEAGNVIHVFGPNFDQEHNGEVRFQMFYFLRIYKYLHIPCLRRTYWVRVEHLNGKGVMRQMVSVWNLWRNTMVKSVFRYLYFLICYKHIQVPFCRRTNCFPF
jgi:hypothetical protein